MYLLLYNSTYLDGTKITYTAYCVNALQSLCLSHPGYGK